MLLECFWGAFFESSGSVPGIVLGMFLYFFGMFYGVALDCCWSFLLVLLDSSWGTSGAYRSYSRALSDHGLVTAKTGQVLLYPLIFGESFYIMTANYP